MSEQSPPAPEPGPAGTSGWRSTAKTVGTGMGCLALLAGLAIVTAGVLAIFLDDPTFWIAVVALVVAVAAFKASRRGR